MCPSPNFNSYQLMINLVSSIPCTSILVILMQIPDLIAFHLQILCIYVSLKDNDYYHFKKL